MFTIMACLSNFYSNSRIASFTRKRSCNFCLDIRRPLNANVAGVPACSTVQSTRICLHEGIELSNPVDFKFIE